MSERDAVAERALVAAARSGDPDALDQLVAHWLPTVLRWCARLGGPRVDPEDAAQEVFVVVMRRIRSVEDPAAFPSWLYQVTRRTLTWQRRKTWLTRWVSGISWERPDPRPGPDRRRALSEAAEAVQQILEDLPALHREIFVLCEIEELTDSAAASLLGIPVPTARSRLRLARRRFRDAAVRRSLSAEDLFVTEGV